MRRLLRSLATAAILLAGFAPVGWTAIVPASEERLLGFPIGDAHAGASVDISGDWAVVGAPDDDDAAVDAGAVFLFQRVGTAWIYVQKLWGDAAGWKFGSDVAIDGDVLAVVIPGDKAVAIFRRAGSAWQHSQRIDLPGARAAALDSGLLLCGSSTPAVDWWIDQGAQFEQEPEWHLEPGHLGATVTDVGRAVAVDGGHIAFDYTTCVPIPFVPWPDCDVHVGFWQASGGYGFEVATLYDENTDDFGSPARSISFDGVPQGSSAQPGDFSALLGDYSPFWTYERVFTQHGLLAGFQQLADVAVEGNVGIIGTAAVIEYPMTTPPSLHSYVRTSGAVPAWALSARFALNRDDEQLGQSLGLDQGRLIAGAPAADDVGTDAGAASVFDLVDGQLLTATGTQGLDFFGRAVAVDGATAVIGVPGDDGNMGAAVVFRRDPSGWVEAQRLVADDREPSAYFGQSVAISRDTIVIGAPNANGGTGAAHVFRRSAGGSFFELVRLLDSPPQSGNGFGTAVAATGDWVFVGAPNSGPLGVVRAYRRSGATWPEFDELFPELPETSSNMRFGAALSARNDVLLVGSLGDDEEANDGGAVVPFFYTGSYWAVGPKITPSLVGHFDQFGYAVATDGPWAVIGSPGADGAGTEAGSAWVFSRSGSTFGEYAQLLGSHTSTGDGFGVAVAISGSAVAIGAMHDAEHAPLAGAVSMFVAEGSIWTERHAIEAWDGLANDGFGLAVALVGDTILAGAFGGHEIGVFAGRAYAFDATIVHDCSDGIDDDADGATDFPADPGCADADDTSERNTTVCDDGLDNDADGLADFPNDPGCASSSASIENPKCDDGIDNDGDGSIDWDGGPALVTADSYCVNATRDREAPPPGCGLLGIEGLVVLAWAARRNATARSRKSTSGV